LASLTGISSKYIDKNKKSGAKFAMADVHGSLKVLMNATDTKEAKFFFFNSMEELLNIFTKYGADYTNFDDES